MALNPLIAPNGYPQLFNLESIVIIYPGVCGNLNLDNNLRIRSSGTLFLTNARMIFVNRDKIQSLHNFALHLNLISNERFLQLNSSLAIYEGFTVPYANYMPAPGHFKFEMTQDPRPLVANVTNFLAQIRAKINSPPPSLNTRDQAYVDPSDPDIIYVVGDQR
jgi:hypothetical protein